MWFRAGEDSLIRGSDVVGFFRPESVDSPEPGSKKAKSVVLLKGGRAVYSALGLGALVRRYREGKL